MATRDDIERVREATDLVALVGEHVALQPRGREHVGLCPFHDDSRPSFAVVTHKAAAFYKCHACGAAGDCFSFVTEYLRKDFGEALRLLAERAGIDLTDDHSPDHAERNSRRSWLRRAMQTAHAHFRSTLHDEVRGAAASAAIADRGISAEMADRFELGCAAEGWRTMLDDVAGDDMPVKVLVAAGLAKQKEDGNAYDAFRNRLIFPIADEAGQPIAFGGRILDPEDSPKYLNSSEHDLFHKGRTLYGIHLARKGILGSGTAIVAEGYTDVIACHQAGVTNVVGTLGTAMTPDHARLLARMCKEAILLFDGDEAGQRAAERAIPIVLAQNIDVRICVLPDGQDPDTLLRQPDGRSQFDTAIDQADDAFAFLLGRLEATLSGTQGLSARQQAIELFLDSLAKTGLQTAAPLRRAMVTTRLAELAGVAPAVISDQLQKRAKRANGDANSAAVSEDAEALPALRRAELDRVGLAMFTGQSAHCPSSEEASGFCDAAARRIAVTLIELHSSGSVSVQHALDALEDADDRTLASNLYFDGQRLVEGADGDEAEAHQVCLDSHIRCVREAESRRKMSDWKESAARDPQAAAAIIEHLRGMGPRAAAMPRASG